MKYKIGPSHFILKQVIQLIHIHSYILRIRNQNRIIHRRFRQVGDTGGDAPARRRM
jgi:hypothetical protein